MRIDERILNRVTLARQLLLRRHRMSALDAVERLVGLQAQAVNAPYLGLWTRLSDFRHADLTALLEGRSVVRSSVLRGTQHLVRADDFWWLRPLIEPSLRRGRQAAFGKQTAGLDLDGLAAHARTLLAGRRLTRPELGAALAQRWPEYDRMALGWSAQTLVPVVHPPPNGTWRRGGSTPFVLASEWLDPAPAVPGPDELVRRYLAAFGPATVADVQQWSGVRGLAEVVEEMPLVSLGGGRFDLPDMTYESDVDVPVRFLPEFDNLIVAYADRRRLMPDEYRKRVCVGSMVFATVLVDGTVRGTWKLVLGKDKATMTITLFERLPRAAQTEVEDEALRLLDFAAEDTLKDLVWT
ncbi:winged helix DNA-binding domain-containing protein [Actinophytocola sp.]|uniref:winged helix DNA-binding domain-containing protein n=1 Tax=Actinophytocola sp. TaxID=1872138 RepID=UPI002ED0E6E6